MTAVLVPVLAEDVHAISAEVWASFLGASEDAPLTWGEAPLPAEGTPVCASVAIAGPSAAVVCLEMPREVAVAATRRMLGAPEGEDLPDEDVADAVGELVNMVGGNIKSLMPEGSTLGLPQVSEGPVTVPAAVEACTVDLSWEGRPLRVRVWTAAAQDHSPDELVGSSYAHQDVELVETSSHPEN